jgi:hypothetical protein
MLNLNEAIASSGLAENPAGRREPCGVKLGIFLIFFAYFFVSRQKSEVGFGAKPQDYRRIWFILFLIIPEGLNVYRKSRFDRKMRLQPESYQ